MMKVWPGTWYMRQLSWDCQHNSRLHFKDATVGHIIRSSSAFTGVQKNYLEMPKALVHFLQVSWPFWVYCHLHWKRQSCQCGSQILSGGLLQFGTRVPHQKTCWCWGNAAMLSKVLTDHTEWETTLTRRLGCVLLLFLSRNLEDLRLSERQSQWTSLNIMQKPSEMPKCQRPENGCITSFGNSKVSSAQAHPMSVGLGAGRRCAGISIQASQPCYGSGSCQFNLQVLDVPGWTFHLKTCNSKALSTSTPPSSLWTGGALLTLSR